MAGLNKLEGQRRGKSRIVAMVGTEMHRQGKRVFFATSNPASMLKQIQGYMPGIWAVVTKDGVRPVSKERR